MKKILITPLLVYFLLISVDCITIRLHLNNHVRKNKISKKPSIFSNILANKSNINVSNINIDAYLLEETHTNKKRFRLLKLTNFQIRKPLNIIVCPTNTTIHEKI